MKKPLLTSDRASVFGRVPAAVRHGRCKRVRLAEQAERDGAAEGLVAVRGLELGVDADEVRLDGRKGDGERGRDLPVGPALPEQHENLALARREQLLLALVEPLQSDPTAQRGV